MNEGTILLSIFGVWFGSGLLASIAVVISEWYKGENLSIVDSLLLCFISMSGFVWVGLVIFSRDFFDLGTKLDKIIILKGKKKKEIRFEF